MVNQNTARGATNTALTKDELNKLLSYNPETGYFMRLVSRGGIKAGSIAGSLHKHLGYVEISVNGRKYYAHRLAYLAMTGEWPPAVMDHISGYRADNRWTNLRPASTAQNNANTVGWASSGLKTISIYDTRNFGTRYRVKFVRGGEVYSGVFSNLDAAIEFRDSSVRKIDGEFASTRHINDL